MKIGELSGATGTLAVTIRFYEREGLLEEPARTGGNYRIYDQKHVERLAFIRHCRSLDMTLDDIRGLLRLRDAPHEDCGAVNELLDLHVRRVGQRIAELRALERQLKDLRAQCGPSQEVRDCGILGELARTAQRTPQDPALPRRVEEGRRLEAWTIPAR